MKFLRCASSQFFLLLQISNLQISSLNSSEIRLCIHFIFTNLNWGIPYYICKRELTVSLDKCQHTSRKKCINLNKPEKLISGNPAFTYDFLISYSNRISDLFRNRVVQYFVEICGFEICRSLNIQLSRQLTGRASACYEYYIIACNFLPIAQYKSLHVNLRQLGMRVQSQTNFLNLLLHF